jgi:hypothetical protein
MSSRNNSSQLVSYFTVFVCFGSGEEVAVGISHMWDNFHLGIEGKGIVDGRLL